MQMDVFLILSYVVVVVVVVFFELIIDRLLCLCPLLAWAE